MKHIVSRCRKVNFQLFDKSQIEEVEGATANAETIMKATGAQEIAHPPEGLRERLDNLFSLLENYVINSAAEEIQTE